MKTEVGLMTKKILGIKIGTIIMAFVCLLVSVVVWLLVKYSLDMEAAFTLPRYLTILRG